VKRCLVSSGVWQKSPVKVNHAQEAAELTGGFRWRAVLQVGNSLLQWSGTLGGNFIAEENDFGCAEDAFRRVNQDPVFLKPGEYSSQVLLVLLAGLGENEDIVQVRKTTVESSQHFVHESLERLGCVAEAKGHVEELEEAEGSCDGGLWNVVGMHRNLIVGSHQVDFGK
jgi:hypothetical protein